MKFVDELPPDGRSQARQRRDRRTPLDDMYDALCERPGQWAEVDRANRRSLLGQKAWRITKKSAYAGRIECTTRTDGAEFVLFARVITGGVR